MTPNDDDAVSDAGAVTKPFSLELRKTHENSKKLSTLTTPVDGFFDGGEDHNECDDGNKDSAIRVAIHEYDGTVELKTSSQAVVPFVIPVVHNSGRTFRRSLTSKQAHEATENTDSKGSLSSVGNVKDDDADAIRALQHEANNPDENTRSTAPIQRNEVIEPLKDSFQRSAGDRETEQLHKDLATLPDPMNVQQYKQSRVPIAEFGVAMLRGMGWAGEDDDNHSNRNNKDSQPYLPRPHRLGLGAIPKMENQDIDNEASEPRRPRTMAQYERDKRLQKQSQDFERQREKELKIDKQITLQDGSLVLMDNGRRAKVAQLAGVPGLNQIKIRYEGEKDATSVKRGAMDRLLTREELREEPFVDTSLVEGSSTEEKFNNRPEREAPRGENKHKRDYEKSSGRKRTRDQERYNSEGRSNRGRHREEDYRSIKERRIKVDERTSSSVVSSSATWVIPQIRVRVVTEKLGRGYFKEKGVVVDVTPKGSTVELDGGQAVLDGVPERYLETALPKVGGRVVVLATRRSHARQEHLHSKGILLERGRDRGVIQFDSDKSVLNLSLDDLAEWVGPLDDE